MTRSDNSKLEALILRTACLTTYFGFLTDGGKEVIVFYNCNNTAEKAAITSVEDSDSILTIQVMTTLSCAPREIDCNPTGPQGESYDLTRLSGQNWQAEGEHDSMTYFFSVCGPLNRSDPDVQACPGRKDRALIYFTTFISSTSDLLCL